MRKYIEYAILWDFLFAIIAGIIVFFGKQLFEDTIKCPTIENANNFIVSLITVSATLIGFLLTIITVIVTFKKGFEDQNTGKNNQETVTEFPDKTIFDAKISKETKFYGSPIHKRVVDVFVNATYEIGIVLIVLLIVQFNIFHFSIFWVSVISFCVFILLIFSIVRSLYIFRLFLWVHLHQKSLSE